MDLGFTSISRIEGLVLVLHRGGGGETFLTFYMTQMYKMVMSSQTPELAVRDSDRNLSVDSWRTQRMLPLAVMGDGDQHRDGFRELLTSTVCWSVTHSGVVGDE